MKHHNATRNLNRLSLILLLFTLSFVFFAGPVEAVAGATRGSMPSDLVEDRQAWKNWPEAKVGENGLISAEGVHIPRFLFDSPDAIAANADLDEVEASLAEEYHYQLDTEMYSPLESTFYVYQDDQILSVGCRYFAPDKNDMQYLNYTFWLADGKRLTDADLADYLGVGDRLLGLMEENIAESYAQPVGDLPTSSELGSRQDQFAGFVGLALQDLWDNFSPSQHQLYLDETGRPHMVYRFYGPAGAGSYNAEKELKLYLHPEDKLLSPIYVRMARELGIDPLDDSCTALIVLVGGAYDEASLTTMLARLWPWQEAYNEFQTPVTLLRTGYGEDGESIRLEGQEYYLLVPKYQHATINLQALTITEDAKLIPEQNEQLARRCVTGPVLIAQNISDIWPNAEINLRYRKEWLKFSPSISLKDGSLITAPGIVDAGATFDWDDQNDESLAGATATFDHTLYDYLKSLLGF